MYNIFNALLRYNVECKEIYVLMGKSYKGKKFLDNGMVEIEGVVVYRLLILIAVDTEKRRMKQMKKEWEHGPL